MAVYFASDVHLNYFDDPRQEAAHQARFLRWLRQVEEAGGTLYLMGDIFDFWFEYKRVIPTGYTAVLGRLAEMSRNGIEIHFFKGNHDMWTRDYFEKELGIQVHDGQLVTEIDGKKIIMGHGHKLPLDRGPLVRLMKWAFASPFLFRFFSALIHPDTMTRFGRWWSRDSRRKKETYHTFRGAEEPVTAFIESNDWQADLFLFGHFHAPGLYPLKKKAGTLALLGEWIEHPVYGVLENGEFSLHSFDE